MLDDQELLATRILNKKAKWEDVQDFIDKNYVKRSEHEALKQEIEYLNNKIEMEKEINKDLKEQIREGFENRDRWE